MDGRPRSGYVPALEGVRGVAIALVVLVHAYARPSGGFLGVDVFFVLSGFLITTLLLREHRGAGTISLGRFYRRRALRLLPALVVFLLAYVVVTMLLLPDVLPGQPTRSEIAVATIESLFYVSNVAQTWAHGLPAGMQQLWSLATEEQFYLIWPLALVWLLRRRASPGTIARTLGVAIAAVATNRLVLDLAGANRIHLYFNPETRFDTLLAGCLFGVWFVYGTGPRALHSPRFRQVAWPLALGATAVPVYATSSWTDPYLYRIVLPLFGPIVGLLVFVAATDARSGLARLLALRPLRYLGRISYSLYLWHPFVFVLGTYGVAQLNGARLSSTEEVGLSVAAAILSTHVVERPFLRRKERLASARVEPLPDAVIVPSSPAAPAIAS